MLMGQPPCLSGLLFPMWSAGMAFPLTMPARCLLCHCMRVLLLCPLLFCPLWFPPFGQAIVFGAIGVSACGPLTFCTLSYPRSSLVWTLALLRLVLCMWHCCPKSPFLPLLSFSALGSPLLIPYMLRFFVTFGLFLPLPPAWFHIVIFFMHLALGTM